MFVKAVKGELFVILLVFHLSVSVIALNGILTSRAPVRKLPTTDLTVAKTGLDVLPIEASSSQPQPTGIKE